MYFPPPEESRTKNRRYTDRDVFRWAIRCHQIHEIGEPVEVDPANPPDVSTLRLITGRASTDYGNRRDEVYTANITLRSSAGDILLQRFGPANECQLDKMKRSAKRGSRRLTKMTLRAKCHSSESTSKKRSSLSTNAISKRTKRSTLISNEKRSLRSRSRPSLARKGKSLPRTESASFVVSAVEDAGNTKVLERRKAMRKRMHLGAWHDRACKTLGLTADTSQTRGTGGTKEGRKATGKFCKWFRQYTENFIQPIYSCRDRGLCEEFRKVLDDRTAIHWPWAAARVPMMDTYCHPLYSTISPFRGFSDEVHKDSQDAAVSILVNFGQHAILELPEYGCKVMLQPFDTVFLRTNAIYHRTSRHLSYTDQDELERWAVSCFLRHSIELHVEPTDPHVFQFANRDASETETETETETEAETETERTTSSDNSDTETREMSSNVLARSQGNESS